MKIDTCKLRAASKFMAKGDVRNYLCGIRINSKFVEATNGHIAVRMDSDVKTKREMFAMHAMQGLIAANSTYGGRTDSRDSLAADAVAHADALLKELEK